MRLVLDTNIVLSALLWRGTPHHDMTLLESRPLKVGGLILRYGVR